MNPTKIQTSHGVLHALKADSTIHIRIADLPKSFGYWVKIADVQRVDALARLVTVQGSREDYGQYLDIQNLCRYMERRDRASSREAKECLREALVEVEAFFLPDENPTQEEVQPPIHHEAVIDLQEPMPMTEAQRIAELEEELRKEKERRYTRIEWEAFAVTYDSGEGVSLRAMVDAGLYTEMRNAVARLKKEVPAGSFAEVTAKPSTEGGRPETDYIFLDLMEAQLFAATTHTPVGREIARVIIAHHNAYQAGETMTKEKEKPRIDTEALNALILLQTSLTQSVQKVDQKVEVVAQKVAEQEEVINQFKSTYERKEGFVGAHWLGDRFGLMSESSEGKRPHYQMITDHLNGLVPIAASEMGVSRTALAYKCATSLEPDADGKVPTEYHYEKKWAMEEIAKLSIAYEGQDRFVVEGRVKFKVQRRINPKEAA